MMNTALLFGATGLTGRHLLDLLLQAPEYVRIKVFTRKHLNFSHPKLQQVISPLEDLETLAGQIIGDHLYCCLGTTIKKAGSKEAFRRIDYEIPVTLARIAAQKQLKGFAVVSSMGANPSSVNFYLRTKGEMEEEVKRRFQGKLVIARPSLLLGQRGELRPTEKIAAFVLPFLNPIFQGKLRKYRAISASDVAMAIYENMVSPTDKMVFESDELQQLAKQGYLGRGNNFVKLGAFIIFALKSTSWNFLY